MNRKLHAMALEVEGLAAEARQEWLLAALHELELLVGTTELDEAALQLGVAEVVACLAQACRPMSKDDLRAIVKSFMDRVVARKRHRRER